MHKLSAPKIQRSYIRMYKKIIHDLNLKINDSVLDIGAGLGFLKRPVIELGCKYTGIETDKVSFENACALYGQEGFVLGYFPNDIPHQYYDCIVALSCADEVPDKVGFLNSIRSRLKSESGVTYIAVRNKAFFVNKIKFKWIMSKCSERSRVSCHDLTANDWENLINNCGLQICRVGTFYRPIYWRLTSVGIRNVAYNIFSLFLPYQWSYMVYIIARSK